MAVVPTLMCPATAGDMTGGKTRAMAGLIATPLILQQATATRIVAGRVGGMAQAPTLPPGVLSQGTGTARMLGRTERSEDHLLHQVMAGRLAVGTSVGRSGVPGPGHPTAAMAAMGTATGKTRDMGDLGPLVHPQ
jgi:hypothetical protein